VCQGVIIAREERELFATYLYLSLREHASLRIRELWPVGPIFSTLATVKDVIWSSEMMGRVAVSVILEYDGPQQFFQRWIV
jgi:hypothetical protein